MYMYVQLSSELRTNTGLRELFIALDEQSNIIIYPLILFNMEQ